MVIFNSYFDITSGYKFHKGDYFHGNMIGDRTSIRFMVKIYWGCHIGESMDFIMNAWGLVHNFGK